MIVEIVTEEAGDPTHSHVIRWDTERLAGVCMPSTDGHCHPVDKDQLRIISSHTHSFSIPDRKSARLIPQEEFYEVRTDLEEPYTRRSSRPGPAGPVRRV